MLDTYGPTFGRRRRSDTTPILWGGMSHPIENNERQHSLFPSLLHICFTSTTIGRMEDSPRRAVSWSARTRSAVIQTYRDTLTTISEISRQFNIPRTTVQEWVATWCEETHVTIDRRKRGNQLHPTTTRRRDLYTITQWLETPQEKREMSPLVKELLLGESKDVIAKRYRVRVGAVCAELQQSPYAHNTYASSQRARWAGREGQHRFQQRLEILHYRNGDGRYSYQEGQRYYRGVPSHSQTAKAIGLSKQAVRCWVHSCLYPVIEDVLYNPEGVREIGCTPCVISRWLWYAAGLPVPMIMRVINFPMEYIVNWLRQGEVAMNKTPVRWQVAYAHCTQRVVVGEPHA